MIALALHAALLMALLSYAPAREALLDAAPIMVSLIQPEIAEKPAEPPKPKPLARRPPVPPSPGTAAAHAFAARSRGPIGCYHNLLWTRANP
jgi:hypothetical protein